MFVYMLCKSGMKGMGEMARGLWWCEVWKGIWVERCNAQGMGAGPSLFRPVAAVVDANLHFWSESLPFS